jgi:hypothetical protein
VSAAFNDLVNNYQVLHAHRVHERRSRIVSASCSWATVEVLAGPIINVELIVLSSGRSAPLRPPLLGQASYLGVRQRGGYCLLQTHQPPVVPGTLGLGGVELIPSRVYALGNVKDVNRDAAAQFALQ